VENNAVRRGLVLVVLVTCTMLLLWWVTDRVKEDAAAPSPTPTATISAAP
jgi:hypothetical protein